ncbi:MAG: HAD family hydrolase [Syntrophobacteria bacterium]
MHRNQTRLSVIFDLDGVLVDSYRVHFQSWLALAGEYGASITETEFASLFGRTSRDIVRAIWGSGLSAEEILALDERKEALYRGFLRQNVPVMEGALHLIDALVEEGFVLALGSSAPRENVEMSLEGLGRRRSFNAVVTGEDVSRGKPDPQVFLLAARRMGMEPLKCAVVEDAPAGISAALAAGMSAVAIAGTAPEEKLNHAHLVVNSLGELTPKRIAELIESNRSRRAGLHSP